MATPTVRRLQLGNELRRLRELAEVTPAQASQVLSCNVTKISRIELGQSGLAIGDVKLLAEHYGDAPQHVAWMMDLARNNRSRGRWSGYRAVVPEWFRAYTDLERDAEDIKLTEVEIVPGLLQTQAYIRALFAGQQEVDIDAVVKNRQERQQVLHQDEPPMLSCVLSESCVRRVIGGSAVMAAQIEHLLYLSEYPKIQIQLRPFDSGETQGLPQRFTMLRIPLPGNAASLEFVHCEDYDDARYIDDKPGLRAYTELWGAIQAGALGPVETRSRLRQIAQQFTEGLGDDRR